MSDASADAFKSDAIETRAVHGGQEPDPLTGAVMTPVFFTSTYKQDGPAVLRDGYDYSRTKNPTRTVLERNIASLEGASWGLCFASGMAAIHTLASRFAPGDHVVAGNDLYGGTYRIFARVFERSGLRFSFVDTTQPDAVRAAMQPSTRCVFIETPSNPLLRITDISACAEIAHSAGALLVVDNTFATPYLQQPLALGADVVVHSLTKYLGGHSDAVAGCLVGQEPALRDELAFLQNAIGGQLGPMDAFLILRGTKTLAVRMDRHCANAAYIARHLSTHPAVERVIYPGLADHPEHEIARKQMRDFGGMVSCELRGGVEAANAFASSTRLFTLAESLGGVESLVEVPATMTHASIPADRRRAAGLADGLVRFSVGIENARDLADDIDRALASIQRPALSRR